MVSTIFFRIFAIIFRFLIQQIATNKIGSYFLFLFEIRSSLVAENKLKTSRKIINPQMILMESAISFQLRAIVSGSWVKEITQSDSICIINGGSKQHKIIFC